MIGSAASETQPRSDGRRLVAAASARLRAVGILLGIDSVSPPWSRWREGVIYRAIDGAGGPSFWWPPGWRHEFRSSLTLGGNCGIPRLAIWNSLRNPAVGSSEPQSPAGGDPFRPQPLPAGSFEGPVRLPGRNRNSLGGIGGRGTGLTPNQSRVLRRWAVANPRPNVVRPAMSPALVRRGSVWYAPRR